MNKKQNFFVWYYENGIHELLEIIKNYFLFCFYFFSVWELFITLFAPWHRDVAIASWRGWHPVKALGVFFENLLSRCIGAFVRLLVIMIGVWSALLVVLLGIVYVAFWLAFPLILLGFFVVLAAKGVTVFWVAIAAVISGFHMLLTIIAYWIDQREILLHMSLDRFHQSKLFDRLCDRLGVTREQLTYDVLHNEALLANFLKKNAINLKEYQKIVQWEMQRHDKKITQSHFWRWENLKSTVPVGIQWRYGYTVNLDRYATDLSEGDPTEYRKAELIGRENQLELLELILERSDQNCVLLAGPSGIGKKTVIHALGRSIRTGKTNAFLRRKRLLVLDLGRAISDAVNQGQDVENALRTLFVEASYAGNVILVIEHIEHFLNNDGSLFHPNIAAVLEEFLAIPAFQLIASSSTKEYHHLLEKQENVVKFFEVIELDQPSEQQTLEILLHHLEALEERQIICTYQALREIVRSASRFNWEFPMPERALDLMMNVITFWEKQANGSLITTETVAQYIALKTGTPQGEVQVGERKKLLDLENILHRHVIGQDQAIGQIARALRRARSGIGNTEKPVGSFLFMGPTGVGKTETAKALAKVYFGDAKKMIRFDMSEYQTPASIDRLLGSQALNQPGQLVTKVKDNPYGLLLLDELEKAYPDVLDIFLQILDEGFVTDAFGEKINFRNMIIIATSNVGSQIIGDMTQQGTEEEIIKQSVIDYAVSNGIFRLEFLNRFNDVIFFSPLNESQLRSVVKLQLKKFAQRLSKEKNIEIDFDEKIVEDIITKGYNPIFGARSLNRFIEETVEDLVAQEVIAGNVKGGEKISLQL